MTDEPNTHPEPQPQDPEASETCDDPSGQQPETIDPENGGTETIDISIQHACVEAPGGPADCDDAVQSAAPLSEEPEEESMIVEEIEDAQAPADGPEPTGPKLSNEQLKRVLEAMLFAVEEPITVARLSDAIAGASASDVRGALLELQTQYHEEGRGFVLEQIAGGFQLLSRPEYAPYLEKLQKRQARGKFSGAALETLAIIAYRQPVGRADVEVIRGVQAGPLLRMLMEKGMIKIVGREEVIGRPYLYGTTRKFLERFGLRSLRDLPDGEQLKMP